MFNKDFNTIEMLYQMRLELLKQLAVKYKVMSVEETDNMLRTIDNDIYSSINDLYPFTNVKFKSFLQFQLSLCCVTSSRRELKNPIIVGKEALKISKDNFEKVLDGVDIVFRNNLVDDMLILNEQLYNAQIYAENYISYMERLKSKIILKHYTGNYGFNYLEQMKIHREKVLYLADRYK